MKNKNQNIFYYSNEVFLNYEVVGFGIKKILLLHGFGASLKSWNDIIDFFPKDEYQLFLIDLKGFGCSSKPKDGKYSPKDQADVVSSFLESLESNQVYLIGHSYGGGIALLVSLMEIQREKVGALKKLILIDCAAFSENLPFFVRYLRVPFLNHALFMLPRRLRAEYTLKRLFYDKNKVSSKLIARYASFFDSQTFEQIFIESAKQIIPPDYPRLISKYGIISIPTMIIWGRNDEALPLGDGIRLHEEIKGSTIRVIDECGHIPQEEKPEETFNLIIDFLTGN